MIIHKMVLSNFFRYYGDQSLTFSIDEKKNVTIIKGENGSGKTTLLSAFYWVFYGHIEEPLNIENMLNYKAQAEMEEGQNKDAFVEIEFNDRDIKYKICRRQRFIKRKDKISRLGDVQLSVGYYDDKGNFKLIEDGDLFFEGIIPKKLSQFFFFDGERIDRLARVDGKEEIKKAILDVLGLTTIELMDKDLQQVKVELLNEIKKHMKIDERQLSDEYMSLISEKEMHLKVLEERKNDLNQIKKSMNEIDKFLREHNSEVTRQQQTERNDLNEDLAKNIKRISDNEKSLKDLVSKEYKNFIIAENFMHINKFLEEKRVKGQLPSDIKITFINDLLERKRCICGSCLIEGTDSYDNVSNLKKTAGRTELDEAYTNLKGILDKSQEIKSEFVKDFNNLIESEKNLLDENERKQKRLDFISKELLNSPEEKIREYEALRNKYEDGWKDIHAKVVTIENTLNELTSNIDKVEKKLAHTQLANEQAEKIKAQINAVEQLTKLNKEIQSLFIKSTRENLDKKIKEVYSQITRKDFRVPVLTDDFELKITSRLKKNEDPETLSTGEGQITSLAFIGSLVSYAREKSRNQLLSDFSGGDFPIVMDSPFGNLDEVHTANVAANIGRLASQIVIVVSRKQWRKEVEENIFSQVDKMYEMVDGDINDKLGEYTVMKEIRI